MTFLTECKITNTISSPLCLYTDHQNNRIAIVIWELDRYMQILDTQSQLSPTLGQNGRDTNGNGINSSQALSLLTAIKTDLEQVNSESLEKVMQLENWIKHLQADQANVAVATEKDCQHEREWLSTLATLMRQGANIDDVFKTLLIEIRQVFTRR